VSDYLKGELVDELVRRYVERLRLLVRQYRESGGRKPTVAELEDDFIKLAALVEERLRQYVRLSRRGPLWEAFVAKRSAFSYAGQLLATFDFLEALLEIKNR